MPGWVSDAKFVVSAQVVCEGVPSDNDGVCGTVSVLGSDAAEASSRPCSASTEFAGGALHDVTGIGHDLVQNPQVDRSPICGHLIRRRSLRQRLDEEATGRCDIAPGDSSTAMTWPNWSTARYR